MSKNLEGGFVQMGGHYGNIEPVGDGIIMKKAHKDELNFYESINQHNIKEEILSFIPKFHGHKVTEDGFIMLYMEDLTHGILYCNVMDIKIGVTSADPRSSKEKQLKMSQRDSKTTTKTLGIRICGSKMIDIVKDITTIKDKKWGQMMNDQELVKEMSCFFYNGKEYRKDVIKYFIEKAKILLDFFLNDPPFHLFSSSLLLLYEVDSNLPFNARIKLIDFTHAFSLPGPDDSCAFGIKNFISILEDINQNF